MKDPDFQSRQQSNNSSNVFQWHFHTRKVHTKTKKKNSHSKIKIVKAFGNNVKSPLNQQNFIFHYINNISLNLETSTKKRSEDVKRFSNSSVFSVQKKKVTKDENENHNRKK